MIITIETLEMEEWIEICRKRFLEAEPPLPPDDWDRLEGKYLAKKKLVRSRRFILLSIASATAIVLVVSLGRSSHTGNPKGSVRLSASENGRVVSERIQDDPLVMEASLAPASPRQGILRPSSVPIDKEQSDEATTLSSPSEGELKTEEHFTEESASPIASQEAPEKRRNDPPAVFGMDSEGPPARVRIAFASYLKSLNRVAQEADSPSVAVSSSPAGPGEGRGSKTTVRHFIPLSFGLDVSVFLNPSFALTTGLEVTGYQSVFSYPNEAGTIDQKAFYLGVPLRLDYTVWKSGSISSWIGFGGKVDHLLYGQLGTQRKNDPAFHWSVTGNAGIQYNLAPNIGLYLQPEIIYYFKPTGIVLHTYRIDTPMMFSLGVGLRFSL